MPITIKITDSLGKVKTGTLSYGGLNSHQIVPSGFASSFSTLFDNYWQQSGISNEFAQINAYVTDTKSSILSELDTRIVTLDSVEQIAGDTYTGFVTEYGATIGTLGSYQYYGLSLNNNGMITGFDISAYNSTTNSMESQSSFSSFDIYSDNFRVMRSIQPWETDTYGDGKAGIRDLNGNLLPAFSINWDPLSGTYNTFFNGSVTINGLPQAVTSYLGEHESLAALNLYIAENAITVRDGDTYKNSTQNIVYMWDGDEWISTGDKVMYKSIVFQRSLTKPATPSGGSYDNPVPAGWSDGIPPDNPAFDVQYPIYFSSAELDNKTDYTDPLNAPVWSEPALAKDSAGFDTLFNNSLGTPATPTYTGQLLNITAAAAGGDTNAQTDIANGWYDIAGTSAIWMATRTMGNSGWTAWTKSKVKGETGEDGTPGSDGSDGIRGSLTAIIDTTNTISHYTLYPGLLTDAINALTTQDGLVSGDQVIVTSSATSGGGTEIFTYKNNVWGINTALRVNGNAVINGTLSATKLVAGSVWTNGSINGGSGIFDTAVSDGTAAAAVIAKNPSPFGTAMYVRAEGSNGNGILVYGDSEAVFAYSNSSSGVFSSGATYGVEGRLTLSAPSNSLLNGEGSAGVYGRGTQSPGVIGVSYSKSGVLGSSSSDVGVYGTTSGTNSAVTGSGSSGVKGYSSGSPGVIAQSVSAPGALGISSTNVGTYGISTSGVGAYGSSEQNVGVFGISNGNYGVRGSSLSTTTGHYGGYFSGVMGGVLGTSTSNTAILGETTYGIAVVGISNTSSSFLGRAGATRTFEVYSSGNYYHLGTAASFTGCHFSLVTEDLLEGDLMEITDTYNASVSSVIPKCVATTSLKSKKVYGVAGDFRLDEISMEYFKAETLEDYEKVKAWLADGVYSIIGANAIGEGMLNVCAEGGNIECGDYLCSSSTTGKAMKQDDDLLHNYTVAKAMEDVNWDTETDYFLIGTVKCKMIACTYHCG